VLALEHYASTSFPWGVGSRHRAGIIRGMNPTVEQYVEQARARSLSSVKGGGLPERRMALVPLPETIGAYLWTSGKRVLMSTPLGGPVAATAGALEHLMPTRSLSPDGEERACGSIVVQDAKTLSAISDLLAGSTNRQPRSKTDSVRWAMADVLPYLGRQPWSSLVTVMTRALHQGYWLPTGMSPQFATWQRVLGANSGDVLSDLTRMTNLLRWEAAHANLAQEHWQRKLRPVATYRKLARRYRGSSIAAFGEVTTQSAVWQAIVATDEIARRPSVLAGSVTEVGQVTFARSGYQAAVVSPTKLRQLSQVIAFDDVGQWGVVEVSDLAFDGSSVVVTLQPVGTSPGVSRAAAASGEMLLGDCRSHLYLTELPFTGGLRKIGSQKWLDNLPSETERRDVPTWVSLAALDS
jgi:hypothetical protein